MCFYLDYDWIAAVEHVCEGCATSATRCHECGCAIAEGEYCRRVWQQEHDKCSKCCDDDDDSKCVHDYGATFEADICQDCTILMESVEEVEKEEGCPLEHRHPGYGGLYDAVADDTAQRYLKRAIQKRPGLAATSVIAKKLLTVEEQ